MSCPGFLLQTAVDLEFIKILLYQQGKVVQSLNTVQPHIDNIIIIMPQINFFTMN